MEARALVEAMTSDQLGLSHSSGKVPAETEIYATFRKLANERSADRPRLVSLKLFLNLRQYPVAEVLPSSAQRRPAAGEIHPSKRYRDEPWPGLLLVHMFYSRLYRRLKVMTEIGSEKAAITKLGYDHAQLARDWFAGHFSILYERMSSPPVTGVWVGWKSPIFSKISMS